MRAFRSAGAWRTVNLKEADAFQRLVCLTSGFVTPALSVPQRNRRLSASGIVNRYLRQFRGIGASKKQTPFSVWYHARSRLEVAASVRGLKEADAFQRLVSALNADCTPPQIPLPQRSRRLSASGMRFTCRNSFFSSRPQRSRRLSASGIWGGRTAPRGTPAHLKEADAFQRLVCASPAATHSSLRGLKEADAFQRLVFGAVGLRRGGRRRTSKKQTPFSVWYRRVRPQA